MYLKLPQLQVARFNETMDLEDASWNATVDLEYSDEWGLNDTRAFRYKYRKALELNASADGEGLTIWLNPCEVEQGSRCVRACMAGAMSWLAMQGQGALVEFTDAKKGTAGLPKTGNGSVVSQL